MTFLDKLRAAAQRRQSQAATTFDELAQKVADDKKLEVDETEAILEASGRSVDNLEQAVQLIHKRRQAIEQIAAADQARGKIRELDAKMETAREKFREIQTKHDAHLEELNAQKNALSPILFAGGKAKDYLRSIAEPSEEEAELQKELSTTDEEIFRLEGERTVGKISEDAWNRSKQRSAALEQRRAEIIARQQEIGREKVTV